MRRSPAIWGGPSDAWGGGFYDAEVPDEERDRRLAARLVAGDEAALREVYREYAPAVLGLATRVLGNHALAEEVMQEVFVRLWQHPERFDAGRGKLRSYLLATTHSRAVERVRHEDALRRRHEAAAREPSLEAADETLAVQRDAVQHAVRTALAELPADQRRAIELAYFDGLS